MPKARTYASFLKELTAGLGADPIVVLVLMDFATLQAIDYFRTIVNLRPYPFAVFLLAHREGGPASPKGVQDELTWDGGHLHHAVEDLCRKGICLAIFR